MYRAAASAEYVSLCTIRFAGVPAKSMVDAVMRSTAPSCPGIHCTLLDRCVVVAGDMHTKSVALYHKLNLAILGLTPLALVLRSTAVPLHATPPHVFTGRSLLLADLRSYLAD